MGRAYYSASLPDFLRADARAVLGELTDAHPFDLQSNETDAWKKEIDVLKGALGGLEGHVLLEYSMPRMPNRIDAIVLHSGVIFVIEFKVGAKSHSEAGLDQVTDYALGLKNFHVGSRGAPVVPVLVSTKAGPRDDGLSWDRGISEPLRSNGKDLGAIVRKAAASVNAEPIDAGAWEGSGYCPTPTIIESARAMYAKHGVGEIRRHDAEGENMHRTVGAVRRIMEESRRAGTKSICFITGVPGAGKTLAGMEIANGVRGEDSEHAVFLSGNQYLVMVLQEALIRDAVERKKEEAGKRGGDVPRITKISQKKNVESFIQHVHAFRKEYGGTDGAPPENAIIFDEAQRAWNQKKLDQYEKSKGRKVVGMSEPEMMISIMDRRDGWASIVCLVGGGQEIGVGEVGLGGWFSALEKFPHWKAYAPAPAPDQQYVWGGAQSRLVIRENDLHLPTPTRSFRTPHVAGFVNSLLECDSDGVGRTLPKLAEYEVVMTRSVEAAKSWLRDRARGTERYGIVACSKSHRLRPHGIYVELAVDAIKWFLDGKCDPKSSYSLEYAATEFKVQGLEVDWACVAWDANLTYRGGGWEYSEFRGTKWNRVGEKRRPHLKNAYRVLLTRARQGMVIFIPEGDSRDGTRKPGMYDPTYEYFRGLGIKEIPESPNRG